MLANICTTLINFKHTTLKDKFVTIGMSYTNLKERLSHSRSYGEDITKGNRCALVMGQALRLKPSNNQVTMRGLGAAEEHLRNMPLLDKFFVKAQDLANSIKDNYGQPTKIIKGKSAVKKNDGNYQVEALDGRKGVIFFQDCWRTPSEKFAYWFGIDDSKTGDHIDLWNGKTTEIYPDRNKSLGLVHQSDNVWFWETK